MLVLMCTMEMMTLFYALYYKLLAVACLLLSRRAHAMANDGFFLIVVTRTRARALPADSGSA